MGKIYKWGILGAGRIAAKFCEAICFTERSAVYAVASRSMNNAKDFAAKYGAAKYYNDYNDLVNDDAVDIIYIATPHVFHDEHTLLCLQHNKPVLCEKPMSVSYAKTLAMINTATAANLFLMEGLWTGCMPFIAAIQSIIKDGIIGEPKYIQADFGFAAPTNIDNRLLNKALGGGALLDVGIYPMFLTTLLFGEPSVIKTISKLTDTGVDEYVNVSFQYPGGQSAQIYSCIHINTAIEAEITGTLGRINIKNPWFKATDFTVYLNDGTIQNFSSPHLSNGFEYEINEIVDCLDKGLLQSDKIPHQLSLSISKTMDEILKQADVKY